MTEPSGTDALSAGAALFNAGHYHAAHDPWEERWLELESGTDEERLLHGLIQFTAVVHHAHEGNWSGARGLAGSAAGYLSGLEPRHLGVDLGEILPYLRRVAADPETVERRHHPELRIDGTTITPAELSLSGTLIAAPVLAGELTGYDSEPVEWAVEYAREERQTGTNTTFIALLFDFVGEEHRRGLVYQRLCEQVQRRRHRERDVEGLFD